MTRMSMMSLRMIRLTKEWTQDELAARTGRQITQAMISQVEAGTRTPSDETKALLAKALGRSIKSIRFTPQQKRGQK